MTSLYETQDISQSIYEIQQHLNALWLRQPHTAKTLTLALLDVMKEAESLLDIHGGTPLPDKKSLANHFAHRAADGAYHRSIFRDATTN